MKYKKNSQRNQQEEIFKANIIQEIKEMSMWIIEILKVHRVLLLIQVQKIKIKNKIQTSKIILRKL